MGISDQKMSNIDNSDFSAYYVHGPSDRPMTVEMAGDEQCAPSYRIWRTPADISVLLYVVSGGGFLTLDGRRWTVEAGDVLTVARGMTYHYEVQRDRPWRILWFNLGGGLYPQLLRAYGLDGSPVLHGAGDEVAAAFARGIGHCTRPGGRDEVQDALCAAVYEIVLALHRRFEAEPHSEGEAGVLARYIEDLLDRTPGASFSIGEAGRALGRSPRQLERLFRAAYGVSPCAYHQSCRMERAKQYLRNTGLSVREVSARLGYCDPYYFSNRFKAYTGLSPRDWRQKG